MIQLHYQPGNASLAPTISAVDPYALMLGRWTRNFARPAVQRAFATEKLPPSLV